MSLRNEASTTRGAPQCFPPLTTLYEKGMESLRKIRAHEELTKERECALKWLNSTPAARNVLMGILPCEDGGEAVDIDTVLAFHLRVSCFDDVYCSTPKKRKMGDLETPNGRNAARNTKRGRRKGLALSIFADKAIRGHCQMKFPSLMSHELLSKSKFIVGIFGEKILDKGEGEVIAMKTIFCRLQIAEDKLRCDPAWDMRKMVELAQSWMPTDRHSVLMECERSWQVYFVNEITKAGYLDYQAGVTFPGKRENPPTDTWEGKVGAAHQLQFEGSTASGGLLEWSRRCFSPEFISYFHHDALPILGFTPDPTSDRFIRCESPYSSHSSPVFFQMGVVPKARLVRATESSKFGDCLLRICNWIEGRRYDHFFQQITDLYGRNMARKFTPPRKKYDLLFAMIGRESFGYHSDSREMLFDDDIYGWEEINLRVMTLFFQNIEGDEDVVELQFKPSGQTSDVGEKKFPIGVAGMHEQGYGNQANLVHCARLRRTPDPKYRRCVWTARATQPLQESGLRRLRSMQKYLPECDSSRRQPVMGHRLFFPKDDNMHNTAGEEGNDEAWNEMETEVPYQDIEGDTDANTHASCTYGNKKSTNQLPDFDSVATPSVTRFSNRRGKFDYYPVDTPSVLVEDPRAMHQLLSSKEGHDLLLTNSVRLRIKDAKGCSIPFGPLSLQNNQAGVSMGTLLTVESVCKHYGIPLDGINSPPWNTPVHRLSCLHLSKRYKSSLETAANPYSAAAEANLIVSKKQRRGFYVYFSGGNAQARGSTPPDPQKDHFTPKEGSATNGVGFTLNHPMTLRNARNMALFEASCARRVVSVFISDQNLPLELRYQKGGNRRTKMCLYAGSYLIQPMVVCLPETPGHIRRMVEACHMFGLPLEPVDIDHLSFLRSVHFKIWIEPIDVKQGCSQETGEVLSLDYASKERLAFQVPKDFCLRHLVTDDSPVQPSTTEMLRAFLRNKALLSEDEDKIGPVQEHVQVEVGLLRQRPLLEPDRVADILKRMMLAYSLRVLGVNIDDQQSIACLCDIPKHGNVASATYTKILGDGKIRYCAALGHNCQVHPYPCPLAAGDAKLIYLQDCNLGIHESYEAARLSRDGGVEFLRRKEDEAAGLLLQCIITESTGNPALNRIWWDVFRETTNIDATGCQLPSTEGKCRHYVAFLNYRIRSKKESLIGWQHGHYKLHPKLCSLDTFGPILLRIAKHAHLFIRQVVEFTDDYNKDKKDPEHLRGSLLRMFDSWLTSVTRTSCWNDFHLSKIFAAFEEMVAGEPFGDAGNVPLGFGSRMGRGRIDWGKFGCSAKDDVRQQASALFGFLAARIQEGDDWYGYLALDATTGEIYQTINGRKLNGVDADQMQCKVYLHDENEPNGGKAMVVTPHSQSKHCFPIRGLDFPMLSASALKAVQQFKLEYLQQGVHYCSFTESMETLAKESLELFSRHFSCPILASAFPTEEKEEDNTRLPKPKMTVFGEFIDRTECCEMHLAAWSSRGRRVVYYDELEGSMTRKRTKLPMLQVAEELQEVVQSAMLQAGLNAVHNFTKTFTLLSQCPDQSDKCHSAYYQEDDRIYQDGKVFIFPIEGVWYHLVATADCALERKDDSSREFNIWKGGLPAREQQAIEGFMADFSSMARKRQHTQLHIFQLKPGAALALQNTNITQGSVVPRQTDGVVRKALLFRSLQE